MSNQAALKGLLAIAVACGCVAPVAAQQPPIAQVLSIKPKSENVDITTPEAAQIAQCNLEVIKTATGGSGYHLTGPAPGKATLRKFIDSDGDGRVDTWSFFKDGNEVYRESITGKGYTFRWIGTGGMKWGVGTVDAAGKAKVEQWRMISADEAAAEAFAALQTGDFDRLKALMISPAEMQSLGLSAAEMQRLSLLQTGAAAKFQKVRSGLPTLPQTKFSRLESAQPGCYPADITGGTQDIIKASGMILFENPTAPQKKHDWLNSGELVQVGNAWRLTDVPGPDIGGPERFDPKLAKLLEDLADLDKKQPANSKDPAFGPWTLTRIQKLQQIADASEAKDKENWYKQIFDNLATAVVAEHAAAGPVLTQWKEQIEKAMPGSNLAAYGTYRDLWATYQVKIAKVPAGQFPKVQDEHFQNLEKFITAYPKAEDAPDAMIQIANGADFSGKDDVAKKWYAVIAKDFPTSPAAAKATGAIRRIDSVGKQFVLSGTTLAGAPYQLAPGKVTLVYYWASYSTQAANDFAALAKLQATRGDFEIVTVNLDDKATEAQQILAKSPLKSATLHEPGRGMESKLASDYGIFGLPHLFLLDRDNKVVNNKAQVNTLDDEIAALNKK